MNSLSGIQIVASSALQNGGGLAPPNIAVNLNAYNSLPSVKNFSNIYYHASSAVGISANSIIALQNIGSNSFPHLFGQVPGEFNSNLGNGILFDITPARTANLFAGSSTANVFIQVLGQAQNYAAQAATVISSAASAQWPGGVQATASGGFSAIGSNNPTQFKSVASALKQLGTLMLMNVPLSGFSNAGCFKQILDSGNPSIGNLHINFFGKTIIDPTSGKSYIIGTDLFDYIIANPVGRTSTDTFQVVALNPLDVLLGQFANDALVDTSNLDAVITFFEIGNIASSVNQWTDCLNISLMLGNLASQAVRTALNLTATDVLDAYNLINAILNINGITNINSISAVGSIMANITPLNNVPLLTSKTSPISQSDFSNLQATFGPGSGTYGNPTVNDILGSTDYNNALTNTMLGLQPIVTTPIYANISSDSSNIANAITGGVGSGIKLSNGVVYHDINSLAAAGSTLINNNANILANSAASLTNVSLFSTYNSIALTHNNSVPLNNLAAINPQASSSDFTPDIGTLSGLTGFILAVVQKYYKTSTSVSYSSQQKAVYLQVPIITNPTSVASLAAFPSQLANMSSIVAQAPEAEEVFGLGLLSNCIDNTFAGQALTATMIEAKNTQNLTSSGLTSTSLTANTSILQSPILGTKTIGGI